MTSYDPRHIPSPEAFEFLVYLILAQENPESKIERLKPPDRGVDIVRHGSDGTTAYQCKHYKHPTMHQICRGVEASLYRACLFRDSLSWERIQFCFSSNLTPAQLTAIEAVASQFKLTKSEWSTRCGSEFSYTLIKNPELWTAASSAAADMDRLRTIAGTTLERPIDQRLTKLVRKIRAEGSKIYLPDAFAELGIDRIQNLHDFYSVASYYYGATKEFLRVFSLDEEISIFWLTDMGEKYLEMNRKLIARGIKIRRLYIFDFDKITRQPFNFNIFLRYCAAQNHLGVTNRIIPRHLFEEAGYDCKLFAIQDDANVMFYSQDFEVIFNRKKEVIDETTLVFDELYESKEAVAPSTLLDKFKF